MSATILEIDNRIRQLEILPVNLDGDFAYHIGETVDSSIVLKQPNLTLYALDDSRRQAVFVETPLEVDLSRHPFYYMAQYEHAQQLVAVPYTDLMLLADSVGPIEHLILIQSIGRCGSTLMSKILNEVDHVLSLSEPDVYSNLLWLRAEDPSRDAEYTDLLRACTRLLCKPSPQNSAPQVYALKFRNWVIRLGDLLYTALPDSKNLFLYRHAETWMASFARLMGSIPEEERPRMMEQFVPVMMRFQPELIALTETLGGRMPTNGERTAVSWRAMIEQYETWIEQGIPYLAVRYEDLNAHRELVVRAIFDYCGLSTADVETALIAFERDSQAGTRLSRQQGNKTQAEESEIIALHDMLAAHDTINTPDYIAPKTLTI